MPLKAGQNAGVSMSAPTRPRYAAGSCRLSAEHGRRARRRPYEAEQHGHRRRLPGAVRADEPGHDPGRNLEVEAVHREAVAVALGQTFGAEHRGDAHHFGGRCGRDPAW